MLTKWKMNIGGVRACFVLLFLMVPGLQGCKTVESGTASSVSFVLREVPRDQRTVLMILNFKNSTLKDQAEKFEPWEFGIASMVMTDLESVGLFNILSRELLKDVLREQAFQMAGMIDDSKAVELGRIAAARYVVTGTFMEMAGNLRIESRMLSVETGTQLGASSVTGQTSSFFDLEKKLVVEMTRYLGAALDAKEAAKLAGNIETRSVEASLNNYSGEIAVLEAKDRKALGKPEEADKLLDQARTRFAVALQHDPEYERAKQNLAGLTMAIPMTL